MKGHIPTIFVLVGLGAGVGAGQLPARDGAKAQAGAAALGGIVAADGLSGDPVRRAIVTISAGDGSAERQTLTDEAGRFAFDPVPPGRYLVTASKPGWLTTYYGSDRPGLPPGTRVALVDGERVGDLRVPLVRGGVIAGRIVDEHGRPMPRQFASLLELRTVGARRLLAQARSHFSIGNFERATDDRGEFRKFGLLPGTYALVVRPTMASGARLTTPEELLWAFQPPGARGSAPPSGPAVGYAPIYHPGTFDASAAGRIELGPGEERTGIDITIAYAPVARVQGVAIAPSGEPAAKAAITLGPSGGAVVLEGSARRTTTDGQGRFAFASVPPGQFRLEARTPAGTGAGAAAWADVDLTVDGHDLPEVVLTLGLAPTIAGRLVFEASALDPPADLTAVRLQLIDRETFHLMNAGITAGGIPQPVTVATDGRFEVPGLTPGAYVVVVTWPGMRGGAVGAGWWLKSVTAGGRDVSDTGFEVRARQDITDAILTFSDRTAALTGIVTDRAGRPAPEYFVFAFPVDRARWTPLSRRILPPVRPATDGRYLLPALPPGEYYLAVMTAYEEGDLADPGFLESLVSAAVRVTVAEGEARERHIRLAR